LRRGDLEVLGGVVRQVLQADDPVGLEVVALDLGDAVLLVVRRTWVRGRKVPTSNQLSSWRSDGVASTPSQCWTMCRRRWPSWSSKRISRVQTSATRDRVAGLLEAQIAVGTPA
jgi:hypothetical protein